MAGLPKVLILRQVKGAKSCFTRWDDTMKASWALAQLLETVSGLPVLFNLALLFLLFFNLTRVPLQNVDLRGCWKVFQPQITRPIICIPSLWFGLCFFAESLVIWGRYEESKQRHPHLHRCSFTSLVSFLLSSLACRTASPPRCLLSYPCRKPFPLTAGFSTWAASWHRCIPN